MADQTRKAIIAQLKTYLAANVSELSAARVFDGEKSISQLSETDFPACCIVEGDDEIDREVSPGRAIHLRLGIMTFYHEDDEDTARDLQDAYIKEIEQAAEDGLADGNGDPTCVNIFVLSGGTPFAWPETANLKFRGRVIQVEYRQES